MRAEGKDFHFFGVGIKNNSGGWDVRSTDGKTKLGTSDISEFGNPNSDKVVVFEGMSDVLAFIQKGIDEGRTEEPNRIICLNSTSNVPKLVEHLQDFKGKCIYAWMQTRLEKKQRKTFNSSFQTPQIYENITAFLKAEEGVKILTKF